MDFSSDLPQEHSRRIRSSKDGDNADNRKNDDHFEDDIACGETASPGSATPAR
jgi:hypothetical protein